MELQTSQTFKKVERINSKILIDRLFEGGSASMVVFPLRVVYMKVPKGKVPASILISVPKKRFHHAVDRNRMKRQVREAYRTQKQIVWNKLQDSEEGLAIAFICITSQLCSSENIRKSMNKTLNRIASSI